MPPVPLLCLCFAQIKEMIEAGNEKGFTDIIIINEDRKKLSTSQRNTPTPTIPPALTAHTCRLRVYPLQTV